MGARRFVYVPMDEDFERLSFTYNAREFALGPNAVNAIVSPWPEIPVDALLAACLSQLGRYGVVECAGDVVQRDEAEKAQVAMLRDLFPATDIEVIVSQAAGHMKQFSPIIPDGLAEDAVAARRGEEIHEAYLRGVHGATLESWADEKSRLEKAGVLVPAEPVKVAKARAKLKEWGIAALMLALCVLLPMAAEASQTKRDAVLASMWTKNDSFGPPGYASDPFTCDSNTRRATYHNLTTDLPMYCNGTAWTAYGPTSPVSGDFVWTGKATWGTAADATNSVRLGESAGCLTFEGTANSTEHKICANSSDNLFFGFSTNSGPIPASAPGGHHVFIGNGSGVRGLTTAHYNSDANPNFFQLYKARGDVSAMTAVASGDGIGNFLFGGATTSTTFTNVARFRTLAAEAFSAGVAGATLDIATTTLGGATLTERMRFDSSPRITMGSAPDAANAIDVHRTTGCIDGEGSTVDAFETSLCFGNPTADGTVTITGSAVIPTPQSVTIADDGAGTAAAATVTPFSNSIAVTCNDANGCNVTLSETGAVSGFSFRLVNISANTVNIADTSGVSETSGAFAMGQWDSIGFDYAVDRWVEYGRSNN